MDGKTSQQVHRHSLCEVSTQVRFSRTKPHVSVSQLTDLMSVVAFTVTVPFSP